MNENSLQKCRTCLKSSTNIFPLTKQASGCGPMSTYGQLLKELLSLECSADFEHLMPQYLCIICCRSLKNTYAFLKRAQYCNNKLIKVISKQLDCLQERTIALPEKDTHQEKSFKIKLGNEYDECIKQQNKKTGELNSSDNNSHSEVSADSRISGRRDESVEFGIVDNDQNDLSLETSLASNKKVVNSKNTSKEFCESEIDTVCPICEKNISSYENIIKHLRTQHDIEDTSKLLNKSTKTFGCKLCSCKYKNKYLYLYHMKNTHNIDKTNDKDKQKDKIIRCRSCDYTARTYAALNYHNRSKHGTEKDKFKCKFCAYMCLKKFDLLTHIKKSHKELIKTLKAEAKNEGIQGEPLNDATTLASSKLALVQEENCLDESEYSSSDDIPLIQRTNRWDTKPDLNTKIHDADEQFSDEEFIRNILNIKKRQTKTSTRSLARRCDECGNIYKNYRSLSIHQRHVHISEDKYSLCPHCGKKYKRKTDLRIHVEKSHLPKSSSEIAKQPAKVREKRFMCTECSYVCSTITILNVHINRHHTGEKPYKCDICFKSFIVPYDLKIHRYLHTGERPYKCPICSKAFRDNSHMLRHKRIHSSERPYKCTDCSKSFTQSYNLSVHKRTHLKERKLNCMICGKLFENRSLLNIHRITENHHDEVT